MDNKRTVAQLCQEIWELESDYDLLQLEVSGVKIWQYIRMNFFYKLSKEIGLYEQAHSEKNSTVDKVKNLWSYLFSTLFFNPFFSQKSVDVIIVDHPRKKLVNGEYLDVYTYSFIADLDNSNTSYEVYEAPYLHRHFSKKSPKRKHLDVINLLSIIVRPFLRTTIDPETLIKLERIELDFDQTFQTKSAFQAACLTSLQKFQADYFLIDKLLAKKNPDKLYLVHSYGLAPWIKAAKERGVEVIEFQHGVLNQYHLGYSFPNAEINSIDYFPDKLLVWNDFWKTMCDFPLRADSISVYKNRYMQEQVNRFKGIQPKEKQILVISQGTIATKLAEALYKNIAQLAEYEILYKLHPGEYDRWQENKYLIQLAKYSNVTIMRDEEPLYRLIATSAYVIGVYSTALFEAMEFNCKILLVDLPGIEYMNPLIISGKVVLLDDTMTYLTKRPRLA